MSRPNRTKRPRGPTAPPALPFFWLTAATLAGAVLSAYLFATRAAHAPVYCPLGSGCDIVQSSRYAALFGIPVAAFGFAFYLATFGVSLLIRAGRGPALLLPLAAAGVTTSAIFVAVQQIQIRATCSLCLLSAALTAVIFTLTILRPPTPLRGRHWAAASAAAMATLVFVLGAYTAGAPPSADLTYAEGLARHLTSTSAVFYGAYWCPHCADQKALFGRAAPLLPYVECDPRGLKAQAGVCLGNGIRAYPTWTIKGQRIEGVLSLEDLARLSGYPRPIP